jgi:hypothetical protein
VIEFAGKPVDRRLAFAARSACRKGVLR